MTKYEIEHRTIRFRLHPKTKAKNALLFGTAGACRYVWNHAVAKLKDEYEWTGKCDYSFYTLANWFTTLRNQNTWLSEYSSANIRMSLKPLETAYKKFFKYKDSGLPKFKGKYNSNVSFPLASYLTFRVNKDSSALYIQRIGWVGLNGANPYKHFKPVSGQVKNEKGKWYVYLVYKVDSEKNTNEEVVGIDRNIDQIALSDENIIELPNIEKLVKRRTKYQRQMARRRKGSRRYLISKRRMGKVWNKIVNVRKNWAHHTSRQIANEYGTVVLENLETRKMSRKRRGGKTLNRLILESCWGILEDKLNYKAQVIKVDPAYTSQTCSSCGARGIRDGRKFSCHCGYKAHADINAAKNILARGVESLGKTLKGDSPKFADFKQVA